MAYYGQPGQMGGMPTATVSGPDMNGNGIPDQLEGGSRGMGMMGGMPMGGMPMGGMPMGGMPMNAPMGYPQQGYGGMRPGMTDYNHNGIPDRQEGGIVGMMGRFLPDNNGNGIPDALERKMHRY